MKTRRWLLPFTFGLDIYAINCAVRQAESADATLVAVSLISPPPKGVRCEHIQQSEDFLEVVQHQAARFQVPIECYEVFTVNPLQSLTTFVHEKRYEGIVLVTGGEQSRLLRDEEIEYLLIDPPTALVLIRLSPPADRLASSLHLVTRFLSWWRGLWRQQDTVQEQQEEEVLSTEEPLYGKKCVL